MPFAALVFAYIDQLSAASVSGHSDELATAGRVREQYLERLAVAFLTGAAESELERRSERAGWALPRTLTCVLTPPAHVASVRARLHPATLSVGLDAVDDDAPAELTVHLVPDVGARRAALLDALRTRASVVGPERPWPQAVVSFRRARRAVELLGHREGVVVDTESHLADLVVCADAEALADLRAQVLVPLADLKPEVAQRLTATLRAWLLCQGRRDDVARELVVHPQTVRYRMGQVRDRFGDRLRDPQVVRDLVVALAVPAGEIAPPPAAR